MRIATILCSLLLAVTAAAAEHPNLLPDAIEAGVTFDVMNYRSGGTVTPRMGAGLELLGFRTAEVGPGVEVASGFGAYAALLSNIVSSSYLEDYLVPIQGIARARVCFFERFGFYAESRVGVLTHGRQGWTPSMAFAVTVGGGATSHLWGPLWLIAQTEYCHTAPRGVAVDSVSTRVGLSVDTWTSEAAR